MRPFSVSEKVIAEHKDITDEGQTAKWPFLSTTASSGNENGRIKPSAEEVLVDTCHMENLITGVTYTLTGTLMDRETGEVVTVEDVPVTASTTFTATDEVMDVDVVFTTNTIILTGRKTVFFEKLTMADTGRLITVHEDIEDEAQSLDIPRISGIHGEHTGEGAMLGGIKAGDEDGMLLYIILSAVSLIGMAAALLFSKKKKAALMILALFAVLTFTAPVKSFAADTGAAAPAAEKEADYTQSETYISKDASEEQDMGFEKTVTVDGVSYLLTGVSYEVTGEEAEIGDITVTTETTTEWLPEKTGIPSVILQDGKLYHLKEVVESDSVKTGRKTNVTGTVTYEHYENAPVPAETYETEYTDELTGEVLNISLPYEGMTSTDSYWYGDWEFTLVIEDATADYYLLGERYIPSEECPDLTLDLDAIMTLIKADTKTYRIGELHWDGEVREDGTRVIAGTGERRVRDYTATYSGEIGLPDAEGVILKGIYERIEEGETGDTLYTVTATALYTRELTFFETLLKFFTETTAGKITAGLLALLLILLIVFLIFRKRRREEEDAVTEQELNREPDWRIKKK